MQDLPDSTNPTQAPHTSSPLPIKAKWTLGLLLRVLLHCWYFLVAGALFGLAAAVIYLAFYATPAYKANAVIGPAESHGTGGNSVLAAYTGLDFGDNGSPLTKFQEVMFSVRAAQELQRKYDIMQHVFIGWDEKSGSWKPPSSPWFRFTEEMKSIIGLPGWTPPTATRLAQFLRSAVIVTPVVQTDVVRSGLYDVSFSYSNRDYAVALLRNVLQETDALVRQDELLNTANRIEYLKDQLNRTQELVLRDTMQKLMQQEEQSRMTLQADKYYAVDVIDPPDADPAPVSPRANLIVMESVLGGMALAAVIILIMLWRRIEDPRFSGMDPLESPFPIAFLAKRRIWGKRNSTPGSTGGGSQIDQADLHG